jgi:hypothetical protein
MWKFWSVKQRTLNFGCQKFGVVIGATASPNINALPTLGAEAAGWLRFWRSQPAGVDLSSVQKVVSGNGA